MAAVVVDGAGVLRSVVLSEAALDVGRGQVISGFVGRVGWGGHGAWGTGSPRLLGLRVHHLQPLCPLSARRTSR